jgi:hypothetical protein
MLTIWRVDFEGDSKQFDKFDRKVKELAKKNGVSVDGPYLPQDTSFLYLFHGPVEKITAGGPELLTWVGKENIPVTPVRYEIAQTPDEFGWP